MKITNLLKTFPSEHIRTEGKVNNDNALSPVFWLNLTFAMYGINIIYMLRSFKQVTRILVKVNETYIVDS